MKLRFDFTNHHYYFTDALQIIQAKKIEDVIPCMREVEKQVKQGHYAAGFLTYEAASAFCSFLPTYPSSNLPFLWFAICKKPIALPKNDLTNLVTTNWKTLKWQYDTSKTEYQQAITKIKNNIAEGNTYQVNYTLRLETEFKDDPYPFYLHMLQTQQANYSAYLECDEWKILSASPELFFDWTNDTIIARPMKGTTPRGRTNIEDKQYENILRNEKNCAENLMIVDLLRNDLGKIAKQGSVSVDNLFISEKYPTVWQLTSKISAKVKKDISLIDVFRAIFPCGSITGAPKINTMKIIKEIEKQPRGLYCGALGIITPNQQAVFSVPIRTLVIQKQKATYGVGSGVTWDSKVNDEYEEVIQKTQILYESKIPDYLLESLLLKDGSFFLLQEHLERLQNSAIYFNFLFEKQKIEASLQELANHHQEGQWKVRLLLYASGTFTHECIAIKPLPPFLEAQWAPNPISSQNIFLYHKTSKRDFYPKANLNHEFLMFNEKDEVTEFVNGNVALFRNDQWLTPPIQAGLLNGTMRQYLLKKNKIKEVTLYKKDIAAGCKLAFMNSVRGWRLIKWQS